MKTQIINCSGNYLSENIDRFPFAEEGEIRFINKGITGCGGTTLVRNTTLDEKLYTICLMPTRSSVICKIEKDNPNVQNIYGDKKEITLFNPFSGNIIYATYDKFGYIKKSIPEDQLKNINLVIDEYHTLTRDSNYRDCMIELINDWNKFRSTTLLSATPDKYLEEAIEEVYGNSMEISGIEYKWNNKALCHLTQIDGSIENYIVNLIKNWYDEKNLYLMVNNVEMIKRIINKADLKETEYHIICSKNNEYSIQRSEIYELNNDLRKFNFITAAGFEGTDIKDENGVIYTVFDINNNCTIFDWQTIIQMWGRCRGSKNYPHILYHKSKLRKEQLSEIISKEKSLKLSLIELPDKKIKDIENDNDYVIANNKIIINPFLKSELNRVKEIYNNCQTVQDFFKYLKNNNIICATGEEKVEKSTYKNRGIGFKELCKMYEKNDGSFKMIYQRSLLVKKAYEVLGQVRVKELGYSEKNIENALIVELSTNKIDPKDIINLKFGRFYKTEVLVKKVEVANNILNTNYDTNHIKDTLESLGYILKSEQRRIKDIRVRGFIVLSENNGTPQGDIISNRVMSPSPVPQFQYSSFNVSFATKPSNKSNIFELSSFNNIVKPRPTEKSKQWLFSECYNTTDNTYRRNEASFTQTDSIVLDIDDCGWSIEDFNKYVDNWFDGAYHIIYKSYSYTEEIQKFRVVFPLSSTIKFRDDFNDTQNFKMAKVSMFPEVQDSKCQLWYYAPTEEPEEYGDKTKVINSDYVRYLMDLIGIEKDEDYDIIEIKQPKIKEEVKEDIEKTTNRVEKFIDMINNAEDGEWNNRFWAAVYYMDWSEVNEVKAGIIGKERVSYFEEKLKYKPKNSGIKF